MKYNKTAIRQIVKEGMYSKGILLKEANERIDVPVKTAKSIQTMLDSIERAVSDVYKVKDMRNDKNLAAIVEALESAVDNLESYLDDNYEWNIGM